ncbi:MAG: aquaporin, partial [Demequinaceae bacterium]|nr:aquaporin [Demequinaceae bacterium]
SRRNQASRFGDTDDRPLDPLLPQSGFSWQDEPWSDDRFHNTDRITMAEKAPAKKIPAKKAPRPEAAEFQVDLDADLWAAEEAGVPGLASRLSAELIGTFIFVFVGLGAALFGIILSSTAALDQSGETIGVMSGFSSFNYAASLTSALAWGITLLALFVAFGRVSGAHFNPAVTIGAWVAGRFPGRDVAVYILVQVAGAVTAASLVLWLAGGFPLLDAGNTLYLGTGLEAPTVGQAISTVAIGDGEYSPAGIALKYGLIIEFIATALLVGVVLAATSIRAPRGQAAVSIGLSYGVLVLLAAPFTGGGLNPARTTATAIFAQGADGAYWGWSHLAWWWLAMLLAGAFVGLLVRAFGPEEDLEIMEVIEVTGK